MQLNHRLILISTANFFQLVSLLGPEGAPLIDEIMEEEARKKNDYSILSEQERDLIRAFRKLDDANQAVGLNTSQRLPLPNEHILTYSLNGLVYVVIPITNDNRHSVSSISLSLPRFFHCGFMPYVSTFDFDDADSNYPIKDNKIKPASRFSLS